MGWRGRGGSRNCKPDGSTDTGNVAPHDVSFAFFHVFLLRGYEKHIQRV